MIQTPRPRLRPRNRKPFILANRAVGLHCAGRLSKIDRLPELEESVIEREFVTERHG